MRDVCLFLVCLLLVSGSIQASLIQHLDAAVSGGVSTNGAGVVSQWLDQSDSAVTYDAAAAVGGACYPGESHFASGLEGLDFGTGRNVMLLFDAIEQDSWLDQNGGNGFCVLVAFKCDALRNDWNDLIGNSSAVGSGFGLRYSSAGLMQAYLGGNVIQKSGGFNVAVGDTIIYAFNYDASSRNCDFWDSRNNSSLSKILGGVVTDFSLSNSVTLGSTNNSNRYFNGLVGEVKIFDSVLSPSQLQIETEALSAKWITLSDFEPPAPNPAAWASEPNAINPFSIVMTATAGTDASEVEYLFTETSGNPGGTSGNWQSSPYYRDDGLNPNTQYSYSVAMRDAVGNAGMTSDVEHAVTPDVSPGRTEGPPNVVIIYADDLGYSDISFNAPAGSYRYTPVLDRICTKGIYFSNYVTHHVCSPSRAGLLTGRHYSRVGSGVEVGGTLDNGIPNIAREFQAAGYKTATYGKWHNCFRPMSDNGKSIHVSSRSLVIPDNDVYEDFKNIDWGEGVNAYGFDDWAGFYGGGSDYFNRYDNWSGNNDWWINETFSPHVPGYTQDLISQNTCDFITENANRPFFVHVSMEAVHTPYHIKQSDLQTMCDIVDDINPALAWSNVKLLASPSTGNLIQDVVELRCSSGEEFDLDVLDKTLSGYRQLVYSTLAYALDKTAGQILDRIDAHGLTTNTIIVFASDNGGAGPADNTPFRGSKHTVWEGGVHVPAAIWLPGVLDAETPPYSAGDNSYNHMVQYIDLYPTLTAMTGRNLTGVDLDGINLYSNLVARTPARLDFENCYFGLGFDWGVIRSDQWKLHFNRVPNNQKIQLYNLGNDISESVNVQASHPAQRDALIALFDQWFDSGAVSASYMPLNVDNATYPLPAPQGEILEVKASQTAAISNPNAGFYVRYAVSDTKDYSNYVHANDQFEFDVYVAQDSDCVTGFYCTFGRGWAPICDSNTGVNLEGNLISQQTFPKGQWVRQVVGMGEIGALPSPVQYIALRNASAGYYHFYIDNVVIRKSDGTIRDVVWSEAADFVSNFQYRYKNAVHYSWQDVSAVSGFPFSAVALTTVDLSALPVDATPPPAPTSLTTQSGVGKVTLDWADDNGLNSLAGYNVYRATAPSDYGAALAAGIQHSRYIDNTTTDGAKYYYAVAATDTSSNESGKSNEDSALPPDLTDDDIIDLEDVTELAETWLTVYCVDDLLAIAENWLIY